MTKQNVYDINKILETVEIPDDNVMLETLLELAKEKQAA